ncbi:hypothetical protein SmJEL517_g05205 [Synchytrium microbalum]|uniref:Uncharacterized protein n=1 Tax=Synchytrium microbalum TaxID=1806994 RepID=A0A507BVE0_9FUNG|nr:uncharacterized protein SmJEL517_g05205 [Synchytrium microbalum]TPX31472.1 hypothetical protein SmJEL517_g05205 [Synchytrium microbalum]
MVLRSDFIAVLNRIAPRLLMHPERSRLGMYLYADRDVIFTLMRDISLVITESPLSLLLARLMAESVPKQQLIALCHNHHSKYLNDLQALGLETVHVTPRTPSEISSVINPPQFPSKSVELMASLLFEARNHQASNMFLPICMDNVLSTHLMPALWRPAHIKGVLASLNMGIASPLLPFSQDQLENVYDLGANQVEELGVESGLEQAVSRFEGRWEPMPQRIREMLTDCARFFPSLGYATLSTNLIHDNATVTRALSHVIRWIGGSATSSLSELPVAIYELVNHISTPPVSKWTSIPIGDTAAFHLSPTIPHTCIVTLTRAPDHAVVLEIGQTVWWDNRYYIRLLPPPESLAAHSVGLGSSQAVLGLPIPCKFVVRPLTSKDVYKCLHSYLPRLRGFEAQTYIKQLLHHLLYELPPPLFETLPCVALKYQNSDQDYLVCIPGLDINFEPGLVQVHMTHANRIPTAAWPIPVTACKYLDKH